MKKASGFRLPAEPMEFRATHVLPPGAWLFEPKWDGFRCLARRDGRAVELRSKAGQPLERYFPEIVDLCRALRPRRYALDGEIVMRSSRATFDDLLQRIHPAASRVALLSRTMPAMLMVFDLLEDSDGNSLLETPLADRRRALGAFARRYFGKSVGVRLSPATTDRAQAEQWLSRPRAAMDGIVAKSLTSTYRSGERSGGFKVKRERTADCVVGGFRYASNGRGIGSLLLGLYDAGGKLNHVGFTSSFSTEQRTQLEKRLRPLIAPPGFTGRAPGGPSRWSTRRTEEWKPLAPKLVVEVAFDRVTNDRIRHGARFVRWRPDKPPRRCTMDQLRA